ncbi:MAG TPA: metallophosphoesterase [Woeseiaceae bacterium]|nr:metallophosphoesterase [Woeseiaceae bacterium]
MRLCTIAALPLFLTACATGGPPTPAADSFAPVSILLFGDTGYDYDYLEAEDYEDAFTGREFVINELDDWIEDGRPIEEFRIPPMHLAEQTGGYVMASGMWPVSKAVRAWCAPDDRCDFGIMLGDNIYPAGATLGTDGRSDAERFDDLLFQPYKGLQEQDAEFVIYPVLGNHDWDTSRESAMAQIRYLEQSPLYELDGIYYRARPAPGVELFAIDTTVLLAAEVVMEDAVAADGAPIDTGLEDRDEPWAEPVGDERQMLAWLERALAGSDARWKIVVGHHPLWSSSGSKHEEAKVLRRLLLPALCRYADAYVSGHDHTLEVHTDDCRTEGAAYLERPPLVTVVSGAAGKQRPVHTPFMAWRDRRFPQHKSHYVEGLVWGFAELQLAADTLTITIVSTPNSGTGEPIPKSRHVFTGRTIPSN